MSTNGIWRSQALRSSLAAWLKTAHTGKVRGLLFLVVVLASMVMSDCVLEVFYAR